LRLRKVRFFNHRILSGGALHPFIDKATWPRQPSISVNTRRLAREPRRKRRALLQFYAQFYAERSSMSVNLWTRTSDLNKLSRSEDWKIA
jgi:hypothetical protein